MNCATYSKSVKNADFKAFMMELCLQWIEQKYNMKLDKSIYIVLTSRLYISKAKIQGWSL